MLAVSRTYNIWNEVKRYLKDKFKRSDIIHDNQSLSYGILSLSKRLPVTATIHHPMTKDRRIAVQSTKSVFKKMKVLACTHLLECRNMSQDTLKR